ncbi:MAG: ribonuclease G [Gammaproteobacteria bacterium]|nr:ribonuclease G [Gammaproteobacteria bacterium]
MNEELLVNITPQETRIAYVENGVLMEVHIERASQRGLVGNIYIGTVVRVLPGMEAAFIDIGLERTAFLHISDIHNVNKLQNGSHQRPLIQTVLHEGQSVLVQVLKDPIGSKGARLTTHISLPSRYLVYMPDENTHAVSNKIEDIEERERLLKTIENYELGTSESSFVFRTAAEGVDQDKIHREIDFLLKLWASIKKKIKETTPGNLVHADTPLAIRKLRDVLDRSTLKVRVDSRDHHQQMLSFATEYLPEISPRIELYQGDRPIFDIYGIDDEIQKALERKVNLKSGGHLILDQTESMTTIDVNTGGFVGHRNLDETIFKTNLEAAQSIARQLRLRNLGGIIIIDFIDMNHEEHKRQVMRALEKYLAKDATKTQISDVSPLGLVQMTRKRTRESLEHILCEPCATCNGRGSVKTAETICHEISREIIRQARQFDIEKITVFASESVVNTVIDEFSSEFAELEAFANVPIKLKAEPLYTQEQYDVVLM